MALTFLTAEDAILSTINTAWQANAGAFNGGTPPVLLFESTERSLKPPHPRDTTKPWARAVIRHGESKKVTLNNDVGTGRYRRFGIVWVQVFVPFADGSAWTIAQQLAEVARAAFEGKAVAPPGAATADGVRGVVYTAATVQDKGEDGVFVRYDMKANFYWDAIV